MPIPQRSHRTVALAAVTLALTATSAADARVTKITFQTSTNVPNSGPVGPYVEWRGVAEGEIDPFDRRNAVITDIELAPRNANGKVTYATQFTLLMPVDMGKAGGILMQLIPNRGNNANPYGTDLIFAYGQVLLNVAWQGDIPITGTTGSLGINVPRATGVVGPVWDRFIGPSGLQVTIDDIATRPLATMDTTQARLISFASESPEGVKADVVEIPSADFAFASCSAANPFPGTPSATQLCIRGGFDSQRGYELVRLAKDPYVLGVGEAAMRDVSSFFRYAAADDFGTANPVAGRIQHALNFGNSQSGRLGKHFLNNGFNEDDSGTVGRIVFDGMNPNIAGMMGSFNIRFAIPGDIAEMYDPGANGTLWWEDYADPVRGGQPWGFLTRCRMTNTCPKIMETYGGAEMWYSHGSPGITGTLGSEDLPLPANVRRYYHAGTAHGGGTPSWNLAARSTNPLRHINNPNGQRETNRALHVAMIEWVRNGTLPPPSAYPRVSDGTLVPANSAALGWPAIPGSPTPDGVMNPVLNYDYGPGFSNSLGSGVISKVPPPILGVIASLAPKVDADGNEVAGLRSLLHRMPLSTYTGWNPIQSGPLAGREQSLAGGSIPFPRTAAERLALGDPRLSIVERYGSLGNYLFQANKVAKSLVAQRLLLPSDATMLVNTMKTQMTNGGVLPLLP
ncbi:alpha/beta hydrolase domain-containing protein [Aquincola sp. MAHUQ-54]|uniref:Alpha/beta hydrolase domain-containing protein n=1 Tax=Aquincola agrisoli TaxID=3119538 RepID=A0AAW9QJ87_9BURK